MHLKQLPKESTDAFNLPSLGFSASNLSRLFADAESISHHWHGPADEPTTLNCGQATYRSPNIRGIDSTGVQLLKLEAIRIY